MKVGDFLYIRIFIKMNLQEQIRKVLKEETEGISSFINELSDVFNISDELKDEVVKFIEESNCKKIEFSNFKMSAYGLALHNIVLINKEVFGRRSLEFALFVIFHEIAHQYQYKKYGEDIMYDCYIGELSNEEAAKFMKQTEEVADEFAGRKIRQLQNKGLISKNFRSPQMYKNLSIQYVSMMIQQHKNQMRKMNINSPEKVSEYFYNMVKSGL
jgi:hypothetical protein